MLYSIRKRPGPAVFDKERETLAKKETRERWKAGIKDERKTCTRGENKKNAR